MDDELANSIEKGFSDPDSLKTAGLTPSRSVENGVLVSDAGGPTGDAEMRQHAALAGETYEQAAKQQMPDGDFSQNRKLLEERVFQRSRLNHIDELSKLDYGNRPGWGMSTIPIMGALGSLAESQHMAGVHQRFQNGQAGSEDYWALADQAREQEEQKGKGWGRRTLEAVAQIPAMALESTLAPGLGIKARAGAGLLERGAVMAGQKALQAPFIPSLWAHTAAQRAEATGTSPFQPQNLAPAMGMAMLQNMVLGSLPNVARNVANPVTQLLARTGTGMLEQQGADVLASTADLVLPDAYKTQTRFGLFGHLMEGERGEAIKEATTQAVMFSIFAAMHAGPEAGKKALDAYVDHLNSAFSKGYSPQRAGQQALESQAPMMQELGERDVYTGMTKAEMDKAVADQAEQAKEKAKAKAQMGPDTFKRVPEAEDPEHVQIVQQIMQELATGPQQPEDGSQVPAPAEPKPQGPPQLPPPPGPIEHPSGIPPSFQPARRPMPITPVEHPPKPQAAQEPSVTPPTQPQDRDWTPGGPEGQGPYGIKDLAASEEWRLKDKFEAENPEASDAEIEKKVRDYVGSQKGEWAVVSTSRHQSAQGLWSRHLTEVEAHAAMMRAKQEYNRAGINFRVEKVPNESAKPEPEAAKKPSLQERMRQRQQGVQAQTPTQQAQEPRVGPGAALADAVGKQLGIQAEQGDFDTVVAKLEPREQIILRGLRDGKNYDEIGKGMGLTGARVQQLAAKMGIEGGQKALQGLQKSTYKRGGVGGEGDYGEGGSTIAGELHEESEQSPHTWDEWHVRETDKLFREYGIDPNNPDPEARVTDEQRSELTRRLGAFTEVAQEHGKSDEPLNEKTIRRARGVAVRRGRAAGGPAPAEQEGQGRVRTASPGSPEATGNVVEPAVLKGSQEPQSVRKKLATTLQDFLEHPEKVAAAEAGSGRTINTINAKAGLIAIPRIVDSVGGNEQEVHDLLKQWRREGKVRLVAVGDNSEHRPQDLDKMINGRTRHEPGANPELLGWVEPGKGFKDFKHLAEPPPAATSPGSPEATGNVVEPFPDKMDRLADEASKRLKDKTTRLQSGFDPTMVGDAAQWLAAKLAKGDYSFANWMRDALGRFGQAVTPHLQAIWDKAGKFLADQRGASRLPDPGPENKDRLRVGLGRSYPHLTAESDRASAALSAHAVAPDMTEKTLRYFKAKLNEPGTDKPLRKMDPDDPAIHRLGAADLQTRMDKERVAAQQDEIQTKADLSKKIQDMIKANPAVTAQEIAKAVQPESNAYQAARKHAAGVQTLIGRPSSPEQYTFKDQADYQAAKADLDLLIAQDQASGKTWQETAEDYYAMQMNKNPADRNQIAELPLTAIALDPTTLEPLGARSARGGTSLAQERITRSGQTKQASLEHELYDTSLLRMMDETMRDRIDKGTAAQAVRTGLQEGTIKAVPPDQPPPYGWKELMLQPSRGMDLGTARNTRYFTHPATSHEYQRGLDITDPTKAAASDVMAHVPGGKFAANAFKLLTTLSIQGPGELMTHMLVNVPRSLFVGEAMGLQVKNLVTWGARMAEDMASKPELLEKLMEVTRIGAGFPQREANGVLANNNLDPTYRLNKAITGILEMGQDGIRVMLADAYDSLVKAGQAPQSQSLKRDFINQHAGNYQPRQANLIQRFLKVFNLQNFATAAQASTEQSVRSFLLQGNTPNNSWGQALQQRAILAAKIWPLALIPLVYNLIRWKDAFPEDVPLGTMKTDNGKYFSLDPTGFWRGAKATGIRAVAAGKADNAVGDIWQALLHTVAGPVPNTISIAATGKDLSLHQVSQKVSTAKTPQGIAAAEAKGMPPAGSSQTWENVKAALLNVNPLLRAAFPQKVQEQHQSDWERLQSVLGPLGERGHTPPAKKTGSRSKF